MLKNLIQILLVLQVASHCIHAGDAATRILRYKPVGTDFVIENGKSFFNRPLYGGNTGFRIEAGDRPEFAFHLPGRGGNLRIGILPPGGGKGIWIFDAKSIVARYRPGSMVYEIRDPLLADATLTVTAIPMAAAEGLVVRAALTDKAVPVRLVWAFGGSDGNKGRRNGDFNAENEPLDRFFQFTPERGKGSAFELRADGFTFTGKPGKLVALISSGSKPAMADAGQWSSPGGLLASAVSSVPVVTGSFDLTNKAPFHMAIRRAAAIPGDPARIFAAAEVHRRSIAERVAVQTPDPFVNAATAALNVAADAIWDEEKHTFMHGAVAWRVPLLGWRGPYAGDVLGRHNRTRRHIEGFTAKQITAPAPPKLPPADGKYMLARCETALNSNGNFIGDFIPYYDMNTVAVDAMFRHLMWTGDRGTAVRFWPALERHLAWQRRLFRRPTPDNSSPLYEAYACIWASDQLMYSGGGATHSSSYQYWHNRMAARLARWLGKDPVPYEKEAEAIHRTMSRELWLPDRGWFAEYKDFLGRKLVHPSAALWTFYHTVDSDAVTPVEAWQMTRFVETSLARIPLRVPGAGDDCFQIPTSNWHPYMWSINNVAFAESSHTALGLWQSGRAGMAFPLMKGALLESMFLGACPGNAGMTTPSDRFSKEKYRDFADGAGIAARAIVEGLFGLRPDLTDGRLLIRPGFPESWENASIKHPDLQFAYRRDGLVESYAIDGALAESMPLCLQVAALKDHVASITVNGKPGNWKNVPDAVGHPRLEILAKAAASQRVVIEWKGGNPARIKAAPIVAEGDALVASTAPAEPTEVLDPQGLLKQVSLRKHGFEAVVDGTAGHRTAFVKLKQGDLTWMEPVPVELRSSFEIIPSPIQDGSHLRFRLRNNTTVDLAGIDSLSINGRVIRQRVEAGAGKESPEIALPATGLTPGTHKISIDARGTRVEAMLANWKLDPSHSPAKWETVDLAEAFNDSVNRIFLNDYLSPRSPYCSLAIPKHGIGGWCVFDPKVEINDTGLRAASEKGGGVVTTPLGVPFRTPGPGDGRNILFVSQWDNHPREAALQLTGKASRACLLMAGSTNPMQSRFDNGEIIITYRDGGSERLALHNPTTWWPIDQDYFIDDFAFARPESAPPRLDLKTGTLRVMEPHQFNSRSQNVPGGAATILDLPLDPDKELRSITVRAIANDVVIGLMAVSLARP